MEKTKIKRRYWWQHSAEVLALDHRGRCEAWSSDYGRGFIRGVAI